MTTAQGFDKWAVLDNINWDPHPGQLLLAESIARHRVVSAGRRFGKSDWGGHELVPEALYTKTQLSRLEDQMQRREFWLVGPEYSDSEKEFRVVYNELKRLEVPFDHPGTYYNAEAQNMHISLWGGKFQVHGKSSKYPDSLVGEGLSGVIMCEAAKQKESIWTKYIRPTLADFNGWSIHSSTPEGKNHFYDKWRMGKNPLNRDWESWRMPAWVNPYVYKTPTKAADVYRMLDILRDNDMMMTTDAGSFQDIRDSYDLAIDDEIIDLMADLTEEAFKQEIGAEFTEFVGRVFKRFDEEIHFGNLPYNPAWATYAAVDYGFTNPNVWLLIQEGPFGEINVIDEFYERGLTAPDFAAEVKARGLAPSSVREFYPDPSEPGDSRILSDALKIPFSSNTGGELKHRLDAIRAALKESPLHVPRGHPDRRPKLMFDHKCKMCAYEFQEYRYPEKKEQSSVPSQENPMKKDDHTPEALGRYFKGRFGTPQDEAGATRTSHGKARR